VFLTENTRRDPTGIRVLLETILRPTLERHHINRFSLAVLMKQPRTTYRDYLVQVEALIRSHHFVPGYALWRV
jgi:hypothetical protein